LFNIGPQEVFWMFCLFLIPFALIPGIFYTLTLQRALSRCAPESRAMEPALVWLLYIPVFNLIWNFIVVSRISTSLQSEFQRRGITGLDTGRELGLAMSILACLGLIPIVGVLAALAGIVCWILYWVKIAGLSGKLVSQDSAPQPSSPTT
jgi:hypothetical protein